jgi:hypothetical protein
VFQQFYSFTQSIGAVTSQRINTPFALFEVPSHKLLLHVIDFKTHQQHNISTNFLVDCFNTAEQLGFKIITIWEDVWHHKTAIVKARIMAMLGDRTRIHARQTTVVRLDKEETSSFLNQHHLQGYTSAYYKLGLMHNNTLVAVCTFSKARTMYDGPVYYRSYELERFVTQQGVTVVGALGKLLNYFVQTFHAKHIMTYADADWGNGAGYIKLGFDKIEHVAPQQFIINPTLLTRTYFHHQPLTDEEINEKGLLKVYNSGSIKLLYNIQKA